MAVVSSHRTMVSATPQKLLWKMAQRTQQRVHGVNMDSKFPRSPSDQESAEHVRKDQPMGALLQHTGPKGSADNPCPEQSLTQWGLHGSELFLFLWQKVLLIKKPVHCEPTCLNDEIQLCVVNKQIDNDLLKGAFDGRGCDFKVLVSPSVHPLVGGDSQSCNLKEVRRGQPTLHRNRTVTQMYIYTLIHAYLKVVCQM